MADGALTRLLAPGRIGRLETRNRIVMAPMGTNLGETDGTAGERTQRYYEARAAGGVGLVVVGVAAIAHPVGVCIPRQLAISDDRFLPGLAALAARVHRHGAKAAIQLQHAGKVATRDIAAGRPLAVPSMPIESGAGMVDLTTGEVERLVSNLTGPAAKLHYRELDAAEIGAVVESFAAAAARARCAGLDGVEIHAGHGYLLASFLSRASNRRTDAYGGSAENRARFLVEVIRAVKARTGGDFPVWCRLDACELRIADGITLTESVETAALAEAAGADAIHVSAYGNPYVGIAFTEAPLVHAPGGFLPFAAAIKRRVRVPVIAVGRIAPDAGERALAAGEADFIAMARRLLADPALPAKLAAGRPEDVRPCVYCYTCVGRIFVNESVVCAVNPQTGRETEPAPAPAPEPRHVLVIGGGPAGMEAARVAALRGHRVTLVERAPGLGGAALLAARVWEPSGDLVRYLETQVRKLPIALRLGEEITLERAAALAPDVIVVAVGAHAERPAIPGIERALALDAAELPALLAASGDTTGLGRAGRVAVLGGGLVGVTIAHALAERGSAVTVLEDGEWLAADMAIPRRWRALHELRARGAALHTQVRVEAIAAGGVTIVTRAGARETAAADHVILASGRAPSPTLADALAARGFDVRLAGDCREVGNLEGAMADGAAIGRAV